MNKNLKKIIAIAMVLGTISAVTPAKNANLLITKAYASDSEADELTSLELKNSDGDSIDLYTDSSYDDELDDDDLSVEDTYYAKTSDSKIVIDSIDGADEDNVRIFKGSTDYEVGDDISISSDTKTTLKVRVYEDEYDDSEDYSSSDYNQYTIVVENTDEDDADLLGISLSNGAINFNPATTSYNVSVPTNADSIIVQATPKDTDDIVKINGTTVDSGDGYKETVSLSSTSNTITIKVSNDDDSKTYTLTVSKTATAGTMGQGAGTMAQGANAGAMGQGANAGAMGTGSQTQGWKQVNGTWYYSDSTGNNKTGWIQDNGKWYYCNADGSMATNTTVGGYKVGADGAWVQ